MCDWEAFLVLACGSVVHSSPSNPAKGSARGTLAAAADGHSEEPDLACRKMVNKVTEGDDGSAVDGMIDPAKVFQRHTDRWLYSRAPSKTKRRGERHGLHRVAH